MYRLYCDYCHWNKIIENDQNLNDLYQYSQSKIQKNIAKIDPITNKIIESKFKEPKKKFRCEQCGKPVKIRKAPDPQAIIDLKKSEEERILREKKIKEEFEKEEILRREKANKIIRHQNGFEEY